MFKFYELISSVRVDTYVFFDGNKYRFNKQMNVDYFLNVYGYRR